MNGQIEDGKSQVAILMVKGLFAEGTFQGYLKRSGLPDRKEKMKQMWFDSLQCGGVVIIFSYKLCRFIRNDNEGDISWQLKQASRQKCCNYQTEPFFLRGRQDVCGGKTQGKVLPITMRITRGIKKTMLKKIIAARMVMISLFM